MGWSWARVWRWIPGLLVLGVVTGGLHGLFFDLKELEVQYIDPMEAVWHPLDRKTVAMLLKRMGAEPAKKKGK